MKQHTQLDAYQDTTATVLKTSNCPYTLHGKEMVERIRRIPSHRVAALSAFGIAQADHFRDCIGSLLIDLEG